jgi:hypothetical protein
MSSRWRWRIGVPDLASCSAILDQWSHVAVTWDGASHTWQLYREGTPCSYTGSRTGLSPVATAPPVVGADSPSARWYFKGSVDSARIYRRALSGAEIAAL